MEFRPIERTPDAFQQPVTAEQIRAMCSRAFGPVAGPSYVTWSEAVVGGLNAVADDMDRVGLDAADVAKVAVLAAHEHHAVLDEIEQPRMLSGDLWTVNVMLADGAAEPTITGVLDFDRTWWGDPAADWTIRMALAKPGTERDEFWATYGGVDRSRSSVLRSRIYEARHIAAIRLERYRLGNADGVRATYGDMAVVLSDLT